MIAVKRKEWWVNMGPFLYSTVLQWKIDFRNKGVLLTYYITPIVFYLVMGSVFSSINPQSKGTLIQAMTIFAVSMAAFLGTPAPVMELFGSDAKKAYRVGNIPLWVTILNNFISALIHIIIVSIIIFLTAPVFFKAARPENDLVYFLVLVLFICTCIAIGIAIGLIAKKSSTMTMLGQIMFLPSIILGGIMFDAKMLPDALNKINQILPATQGFKVLSKTGDISFSSLYPLLIITVVAVGLVLIFYKRAINKE
jgi:ABC-2 type transport system permease protein